MRDATSHHNIIVFYHWYSAPKWSIFGIHGHCPRETLSLDETASEHLGVLNFDLGVVEDEVVVVDVLDDLHLLVPTLLLRLRRPTPPAVRPIHIHVAVVVVGPMVRLRKSTLST